MIERVSTFRLNIIIINQLHKKTVLEIIDFILSQLYDHSKNSWMTCHVGMLGT